MTFLRHSKGVDGSDVEIVVEDAVVSPRHVSKDVQRTILRSFGMSKQGLGGGEDNSDSRSHTSTTTI